MFIREKVRANGSIAIQIVENTRSGKKIKQRVLRHIGQAFSSDELDVLRKLAVSVIGKMKLEMPQMILPGITAKELFCPRPETDELDYMVRVKDLREKKRIIEGIGEVFGRLYSELGFDNLVISGRNNGEWNKILKACVLARIAFPASKLQTVLRLERDFSLSIPLEKMYRMMDSVAKDIERIKEKVLWTTLQLIPDKVDVLFFDVTTLHFESIETDSFRQLGFSKAQKFKEGQVVLALVTTRQGLPITYELFKGSMYEGYTLVEMIMSLEKRFEIENVVLVADRAMFSESNLSLMESKNIRYVVAAKLRSLPKRFKEQILRDKDFKCQVIENEIHWVKEYAYKDRRLIVSYNNSRARRDEAQRARLIERLMAKVKNNKIPISSIISNHGTKRFIKINNSTVAIDENKIKEDSKWDGLHGVISNCKNDSYHELISRYRGLWEIEAAFRLNKHDLQMRPIFHWTENRIRAHIAICFVAYTLVKQATCRIASEFTPLSFNRIKEELLQVQSSVVLDLANNKLFLLPSKMTNTQKRIYGAFNLRRSDMPRILKN